MTDLVVGVRLKADGTGLVGQLRAVKGEVDGVGAAASEAAAGARELASSTAAVEGAAERATKSERDLSAAVRDFSTQQRQAATVVKEAANDNARHANGIRNLGQQFGDLAVMVGGGIDPLRAFATQAGQMGYALSELNGKAGKFGAFLTGTWGIALTVGVTLLGPLIDALTTTEKASDQAKAAAEDLAKFVGDIGTFFDKATGKIRETNQELLQFAILSRQQKNDQLRGQIVGLAQSGDRARDESKRNLKPVLAERGLGRDIVPTINFDVADALKLPLDQANTALLRIARSNSTNAKQAADLLRDRALFRRTLGEIEKNNAEIASLRTGTLAPSLRSREGAGGGGSRTAVLDQEAKLAAATTARERAQAQLALTQTRGRAAVDAGTMSEAQYRDAVTAGERAVNAAQAAERGASAARREANKDRRDAAKATREAEQAERQLEASLDRIAGKYDPARAAARSYRDELEEIGKLISAGKLTQGEGFDYMMRSRQATAANTAREFDQAFRSIFGDDAIAAANESLTGGVEAAAQAYRDGLVDAARVGGDALVDAVKDIGDMFGVNIGGALNAFTSSGRQRTADNAAAIGGLATKIGGFFSKDGAEALGKSVGDFAGKRLKGAAEGQAAASLAGLVGIKTNATGAALGGALGSFIPGGSAIGGLLGGMVGGLFGAKKDYATATVTGSGDATVSGNQGAAKTVAGGLAGSVQENIAQIAEQLGGQIGSYLVSIGTYDGDYRVSTSGQTGELSFGKKNKSKSTLYDFGADEGAALAFATADAIKDGAIKGLSPAVQKALQSNTDVQKALAEAIKVRALEQSLGGVTGQIATIFADFDAAAAERVTLAKKYGLDLLKVEKANAEERASLLEQTLKSRVGSLQDLLSNVQYGDLFEGSASERRSAIVAEIAEARADAEAGVDGAADRMAELYRTLISTSKEAFGTAGPEYGADRDAAIEAATRVIAIEQDRIKDAQATQAATAKAVESVATLTSEGNDLQAASLAVLQQILAAQTAGGDTTVSANLALAARGLV